MNKRLQRFKISAADAWAAFSEASDASSRTVRRARAGFMIVS